MDIWSFKQKLYPDGCLNKHKTRLCFHGGQQTWGKYYWDNYAPVVTWASVRLLLVVAKIHNLNSRVHGGQQIWGKYYWGTYAPLVTWDSVRLLLVVAKIHNIDPKSINFVLESPKSDLPIPVFMELPSGVTSIDETDSNR